MSLENAVGIAARAVTGNAAKVLPRRGRPVPISSPPIPVPQIPLPKSPLLLGGCRHRRQHEPVCSPRIIPGANRRQFPPPPNHFTRCDRGPVALRLGCGSAAQCSAQLCDPVGICDLIVLPAFRVDRTEHAGKGGGAQTIPLYENTEISRPAGCCCGCGLSLHLGGSRGGLRAGRRPPDLDLSEHEVR